MLLDRFSSSCSVGHSYCPTIWCWPCSSRSSLILRFGTSSATSSSRHRHRHLHHHPSNLSSLLLRLRLRLRLLPLLPLLLLVSLHPRHIRDISRHIRAQADGQTPPACNCQQLPPARHIDSLYRRDRPRRTTNHCSYASLYPRDRPRRTSESNGVSRSSPSSSTPPARRATSRRPCYSQRT